MACFGKKTQQPPAEEKVPEADVEEVTQDSEGVPIDVGWAWVISVCVALNLTIIVGYKRAISVLFVDIKEEFGQTATVVSIMFTIQSLTTCVFTLLTSNVLMTHFPVRRISVTAAIFNALGTAAVSHAPNISLFLALNLIKGATFGCLLVCPISLIGYYFKKRRNLALSVASSGFCAAFIVLPPITEVLRSEYGLRGCLLLIAAIELHLVAANMLLRSPESYKKLHRQRMSAGSSDTSQMKPLLTLSAVDSVSKTQAEPAEKIPNFHDDCQNRPSSEIAVKYEKRDCDDSQGLVEDDQSQNDFKMSQISAEDEDKRFNETSHNFCKNGASISIHNKEGRTVTGGDATSSFTNSAMKREGERDSSRIQCKKHSKSPVSNLIGDVSLRGSQYSLSAPDGALCTFASTTSLSNIDADKVSVGKEELCPQDDGEDITVDGTGHVSCIRKFFDVSLFKSWLFRMMAVYVTCSAALNFLITYMPVMALSVGVSKRDTAMYMTVGGVMDLITRIAIGFVADTKFITKPKLIIIGLLVLTVLCQTSPFFLTKDTFLVFAIIFGIFGGFRQNLMVSMVTDYVGVDKVAKGFAICAMLTTLFLSSNHPILGAMMDATGNFFLCLHYVGAFLFVAILVLACEPFFALMERKRLQKVTDGVES